jgi:multidrug resistance protein, MATE family
MAHAPHDEHRLKRPGLARELWSLSWPITISMLSFSAMTAVDTAFVGRFGADAIAAVGLGGVFAFTVLCLGLGLVRGVKILVSQAVGAERPDLVPRQAAAGLLVATGVGIASMAVGWLMAPALHLVAASPRAGELGAEYFAVRVSGALFVLWAAALREAVQGTGDSRSPMGASLVANLVNIPLLAWLVLGLGWGVVGSAWANVAAQALECAILVWQRRSWVGAVRRVERSSLGAVVRNGWPLGLEMLLDCSSFTVLIAVMARMPASELAAHQIAMQVAHLTMLPCLAVAEAASVLAGQAVGSSESRHVRQVARYAWALVEVYALGSALILLGAPALIVRVFSSDPEVSATGTSLLRIAALFQFGFGAYIVGKGALRGTGDVRYAAVVTVGMAWLCTPTLAIFFGLGLGWGAVGGWVGLCTEVTLASLLYWWRLERGAWAAAAERTRSEVLRAPACELSEAS